MGLTAFAGIGEAKADQSPWMIRGRAIIIMPQESAKLSIPGNLRINNQVMPEADITYFFDKHWAAELILAVSQHEIKHTSGLNLGKTWVLPPTVTVQYHLDPDSQKFRPYIGAGVNYTKFFGHGDADPVVTNVKLKDSVGFALQAGFDIPINDHWTFNVDVKKVWMNTKATGDLSTPAIVKADVDINPVIVGVGFGYRF
jgi:outer membrane protein